MASLVLSMVSEKTLLTLLDLFNLKLQMNMYLVYRALSSQVLLRCARLTPFLRYVQRLPNEVGELFGLGE